MKITIDFELDRLDYFDDEGNLPPPEVSDEELVLSTAHCDYNGFAFRVADQIIETLEESLSK